MIRNSFVLATLLSFSFRLSQLCPYRKRWNLVAFIILLKISRENAFKAHCPASELNSSIYHQFYCSVIVHCPVPYNIDKGSDKRNPLFFFEGNRISPFIRSVSINSPDQSVIDQ